MSQEIDFAQLIELLDRALTSKDPKVIQALKKFLFIAALATEENTEPGPFTNLLNTIEQLKQRVGMLESTQIFPNSSPGWPQPYSPNVWSGTSIPASTTWVFNGTHHIPMPTVTAPAGVSGSGTTTIVSSGVVPPSGAGGAGSANMVSNYASNNYWNSTSTYDRMIDDALADLDMLAEDK